MICFDYGDFCFELMWLVRFCCWFGGYLVVCVFVNRFAIDWGVLLIGCCWV